MDPFTWCLLLAAVVVRGMRIARVDAQYARQGLPPPSRPLVDWWLNRQKRRGKTPADAKPARFGMRSYFAQLWFALWEDLGERQREKRQARRDARAAGVEPPEGTSWWGRIRDAWSWSIETVQDWADRQRQRRDDRARGGDDDAADPGPEHEAETGQPDDGPRIACDRCGQTLVNRNGTWEHPSSAGCPADPPPPDPAPDPTPPDPGPTQDPEPTPEPAQNQHAEPDAPASAGDATTAPEGDTMTAPVQQSGEVTGIRSAVHYAQQMAAAHASHGGNEGYLGSLNRMEVGPEDVSDAQAAMEASRNAAELWQRHADNLQSRNAAVNEAYSSSPGAGNKDAQINE